MSNKILNNLYKNSRKAEAIYVYSEDNYCTFTLAQILLLP